MKFVVTFLLSLGLILLSGHNYFYNSIDTNYPDYSSIKSEQSNQGALKLSNTIVHKGSSSRKEGDTINATETEDDDEIITARKLVEINNYFITFFYDRLPGYLDSHLQTCLPICKYVFYTSPDKYILQRAIKV